MKLPRVIRALGRMIWRERAAWLVPVVLLLLGLTLFILLAETSGVLPLLYR